MAGLEKGEHMFNLKTVNLKHQVRAIHDVKVAYCNCCKRKPTYLSAFLSSSCYYLSKVLGIYLRYEVRTKRTVPVTLR
jgi:hypothetical protein